MTRQTAAAYRSGAAAYRNGKSRDANPYMAGEPTAFAWMCGYINEQLRLAA